MEDINKQKKIRELVEEIIEPSIDKIKRFRGIKNTPHSSIKSLLDIFFPKTKHISKNKGFFKNVYIIYSKTRFYALKEGRKEDIRKDYDTYQQVLKKEGKKHFAKIYWRSKGGKFILQKAGEKVKVPDKELIRLKEIGREYNLKDVRKDNIMRFGKHFKIIDAERK